MSSTHVIAYSRDVMIERTIHIIECAACSVDFGIGADYMAKRRKDSGTFYCPSGHSNFYKAGKSDEQKLREATARETALKDQLSAAIRDAETTRVTLLRDRQRFANGVCPCCNRTFQNVLNHMKGEHPDYDVSKVKQPRVTRFPCSCGRSFGSLAGLRRHQTWQRYDGWDEPAAGSWSAHLTVVAAR